MQSNTIPFTLDSWCVDAFSTEITLDLPTGPVELSFGWCEFGGWTVYSCTDGLGDEVVTDTLAEGLGFANDFELFAALTEDLFVANFHEADLFVKLATPQS